MFSKTTHNSVEDAIDDALDENTSNDTATINFDTGEQTFTIQFIDPPEDNREAMHNVTGYKRNPNRHDILREVDLKRVDDGPGFLVFSSEATTKPEVISEVKEIATVFDASLSEVTETKTYAAGKPTLVGNLKYLLGME